MAEERVTQEYVEVASTASTETRITQEYVEVASAPFTEVRVAQEYVEVASRDGDVDATLPDPTPDLTGIAPPALVAGAGDVWTILD